MSDSSSQNDLKIKLSNCYVCQSIYHLDKDCLCRLNSSYPLNYADQLVTGLAATYDVHEFKGRVGIGHLPVAKA